MNILDLIDRLIEQDGDEIGYLANRLSMLCEIREARDRADTHIDINARGFAIALGEFVEEHGLAKATRLDNVARLEQEIAKETDEDRKTKLTFDLAKATIAGHTLRLVFK